MENYTFVGFWRMAIRGITFPLLFLTLILPFGAKASNPVHSENHGKDFSSLGWEMTLEWAWRPFDFNTVDCDGDGVSCKKEELDGTDPKDPCSFILESQDCDPSKEWKADDCDGDGVTNEKERKDKTDPLDPCSLILEHQNCKPTDAWKQMDCDGDGVTNEKEKEDKTDPLDPCSLIIEHQNCDPSDSWKNMDCDGDGVTNEKEKKDNTDPFDPCDFKLESQTKLPSLDWKNMDCDGDGVTNWQEKKDSTDPLDPCDYKPESVTLPQSGDYLTADCDGDGVTNEKEKEDGTDPLDPCDFKLESQTKLPSLDWKNMDCDGDGVTNWQEKKDSTDPLDPCDYKPESVTLPQSGDYLTADCDGDGVPNEKEKEDGTDPLDPCDFKLDSQSVPPSSTWNTSDCDGDGVPNEKEKEDGTDPLDPCDYKPESVTLPQSGDYLTADCDGDGVPNEKEKEDGTDPNDPCDFKLDSQSVPPSSTWNTSDCDGDGVPNEKEKEDGTDPLDPCDYKPESVTLPQTADWENLDCDDDGNPNGPDPNPLAATAVDDFGSTNALTLVTLDILANDDFLPNDDTNNLGVTALTNIGGNAQGSIIFDADSGLMSYTPVISESNTTVSIVYQVCNVLPDPSVCATATVYIEVGANTLDAVDDQYSVVEGTTGPIPDSNVLANDLLNGSVVAPAGLILSSNPTAMLTVNADGSVSVAAGTAPGSHTIEYTICEIANPTNCDTATVTVVVQQGPPNVIDAVDDSYTMAGTEGGLIQDSNVLANDLLNGTAVTLETVILSSNPTAELSIGADGSLSMVPGTQPGSYTIEYTICEIADVDNCDTATVTVVVQEGPAKAIDAVDDSYTTVGTEGGLIPGSNVLANDLLDGTAVTLETVILSSNATAELSIGADGSLRVVPGTQPGSYTIEYTICEISDVDNCDTATVTVVVQEGPAKAIDAVDDAFTVAGTEGGQIPGSNVLSNDTLDGSPVTPATVILSSTPTTELTIHPDGSIEVVPGTPPGSYTISYTLCELAVSENCDTATVTVMVEGDDGDGQKIQVNQMLTPNGDLKNDFLFIRGVEKIKSSTFTIFNRYGKAVYEGKNYNNIHNVFDGRSRGRGTVNANEYLPAGVYFYIFNYETDQGRFTDSEYIYISR